MKRIFILMFGILLAMPSIYSQTIQNRTEDFDGKVTITPNPSDYWGANSVYQLYGTSTTTTADAVYLSATDAMALSDIDHNNDYVSQSDIGDYSVAMTMATMEKTFATDKHTTRTLPVVMKETGSLDVSACPSTYIPAYTQTEATMEAIKTVSVDAGSDYTTIAAAIADIQANGLTENLTLQLKGNFPENVDLTVLSASLNGYTLTITSYNGDTASAIINPSTGVGIKLGNNSNIVLKDITVDVVSGTPSSSNLRYAIQFSNACTNIVVRACNLLATPTATLTYSTVVYKPTSTGVVDNISFINNTLDGGYYGFYFYGGTGTSAFGKHVVFDSNIVSNQYSAGIYSYYTDTISSYSYNTILSRLGTSSIALTWGGMYLNSVNGPVIGNRIIQRTNSITNSYGINLTNYNRYLTNQTRYSVYNNEIILNTVSTAASSSGTPTIYYSGISATYTKADILHNSIYISGTGIANGIFLYGTNNNLVIKNNNIVTTSPAVYPIYFSSNSFSLTNFDIDYNNYYSPNYIGYYYGTVITTMPQWQQQITTDLHSVNVLPDFIDEQNNLRLKTAWWQFLCNRISSVITDIDENPREALTTMGCYDELPSQNINASLIEITGLREGNVIGETDAVKVKVYNTGLTPLTSINLEWAINGVSQKTGGNNYDLSSLPLNAGESTTLSLGNINYTLGTLEIKIWINNVNSAGLDENRDDDTTSKSILVCSNIGGFVTIGSSVSSDYKSFKQMWNALQICGASGDLIIAFEPGTYTENIDLSDKTLYLSDYALTITSTTSNSKDVIIYPSGAKGILFGDITVEGTVLRTKNVTLKDITVDATVSKGNAIQFEGLCTNIVIRDCRLLADPAATTAVSHPVYKGSSTRFIDSVFFINNIMDGGYHGCYLWAGNSLTDLAKHIVFDNNIVTNFYMSGFQPIYTDMTSCSYNTIISRAYETSQGNQGSGLYINSSSGPIIGNRIFQSNSSDASGIYLLAYNNKSTDIPLVANNEIFMSGNYTATGTRNAGIVVSAHAKAKILHNSIYVTRVATNITIRGIYVSKTAADTGNLVIKNNNIILKSTSASAYPIYMSSNAAAPNQTLDINYNNYYVSSGNVGYHGSAKTMTNWQIDFPTDMNSVSVLPTFVHDTSSLELLTYPAALKCPTLNIQGMEKDIRGVSHPVNDSTYMGAYTEMKQCPTLSGIKKVDVGGDFTTLSAAIKSIRNCGGLSGDLTLQLNGIFYENIDLTELSPLMNGYTLTITSYKRNPAGAVIRPSIGVGITLGNTRNIVLKDITVNVATGSPGSSNLRHVIHFTNTCTNIVVRDCRLMTSISSTATTNYYSAVYKPSSTGLVDSIFFINNTISGGYGGIYFYGGTGSSAYATHVVFDSNVVSNFHTYGIYTNYVDMTSCSYNTISGRTTQYTAGSSSTPWYGMYLSNTNGPVIGNRIIQRNNIYISFLYGIYLYYYGYYNTDEERNPVVNNEIILSNLATTTGTFYGIYASTYVKADILHNSIYASSIKKAIRGIYIGGSTYSNIWIKNNNIVLNSDTSASYPIYTNINSGIYATYSSYYSLDYNNYYVNSHNNIVYYGTTGPQTLADWRTATDYDDNSVQQLPAFIDDTISLELSDYPAALSCPVITGITGVGKDIRGFSRSNTTYMGAYTSPPVDMKDLEIESLTYPPSEAVDTIGGSVNVSLSIKNHSAQTASIDRTITLVVKDSQGATIGDSITETLPTIEVSTTTPYTFTQSYIVPNVSSYSLLVYLDNADVDSANDTINYSRTAIDVSKDLEVVSITYPVSSAVDTIGGSVNVIATVGNPSSFTSFAVGTNITVVVANSQGQQTATFTEKMTAIGTSDTVIHTFTQSYTVPNDTVYYLTVYIDSYDNNTVNDTIRIRRTTKDISKDLEVVSITSPASGTVDIIGNPVNVTAKIGNPSPFTSFGIGTNITVVVANSQGQQTATFTEKMTAIGTSDTVTHTFTQSYTVPNDTVYYLTVYINSYDENTVNDTIRIQRTTKDVSKDLKVVSIIYPPVGIVDTIGNPIQVIATVGNLSQFTSYAAGTNITVAVKNSQGQQTATFTEKMTAIGTLDTVTHTFTQSYTVPNDTVYYLIVYIDSYDENTVNDTIRIQRTTKDVSKDLEVVSIMNPVSLVDTIGNTVQLSLSIKNNSNYTTFSGVKITAVVKNSQGQTTATITGTLPTTGVSSTPVTYTFPQSYTVPNDSAYTLTVYIDSGDVNTVNDTISVSRTAIDTGKDLKLLGIINPVSLIDTIGNTVQLSLEIKNNSNYTTFTGINITAVVENSQGQTTATLNETLPTIGVSSMPVTYTFTQSYTVPNDLAYTLTVYIDSGDVNTVNDTISVSRTAIDTGKDLELLSIINPLPSVVDTIGNTVQLSFEIKNNSNYTTFTGINITAVVENSQGQTTATLNETLPTVEISLTPITYTFSQSYIVPNDSVYSLTVYIDSYDDNSENDTIIIQRPTMDVSKDLEVVSIINPALGVVDTIGNSIQVEAMISNHSSFTDFSDVNITLVVEDLQGQQLDAFTEIIPSIAISTTIPYTFSQSYTVPNDSVYYLIVYIDRNDNNLANDTIRNRQRAKDGRKDLELVTINNPSSVADTIGKTVTVSATIRNHSSITTFSGTNISVIVKNSQGEQIGQALTETIPTAIQPLDSIFHTFNNSNAYTVPDDSVYYLTVYIESDDDNLDNDTITVKRTAVEGSNIGIFSAESMKGFTLGQNIPNPANSSTRIDYNIPEAGEVIFYVHSVSGQLLYSKTIEASSGTNSIELNTTTFAAGVYIYSIAYKGQRLLKRMSVK